MKHKFLASIQSLPMRMCFSAGVIIIILLMLINAKYVSNVPRYILVCLGDMVSPYLVESGFSQVISSSQKVIPS